MPSLLRLRANLNSLRSCQLDPRLPIPRKPPPLPAESE